MGSSMNSSNILCVLAASFWVLVSSYSDKIVMGQDEIKPLEDAVRTWTVEAEEGRMELNARLVGLKQGFVQFEEPGGKKRSFSLDKLKPEDRRAALIDRVGSGVVVIATKDVFGEPSGFGSGFVIHASGRILTNYHVVAGAGEVEVSFRDHDESVPAKVLSMDRKRDVAVLSIERVPEGVHVIELYSQQLPLAGSSVWSIGHPGGLENTVGWGNINAVRKTRELPEELRKLLTTPEDSPWLQTNAVLAKGSSGGPLLNERGQAVGINTLVLGPQFGFAIHISEARAAYHEANQAQPMKLPFEPSEEEDALSWLSREVSALLKEYSEEYAKFEKAVPGMSQPDALSKLKAMQKKYGGGFLQLAKKLPQGWPQLQALAYGAQICNGDECSAELDEICRLALEHHGKSQHLEAVVKAVASQPTESARDFCRRVAETSPHEKIRLGAVFRLGANLLQWLQAPDSIDLPKIQERRDEVEAVIAKLKKTGESAGEQAEESLGKALATILEEQLGTVRIGQKAAEIEGVDIEGTVFKLSDYDGKAVLLDFFADWCPHCRRMYPSERALVERMKDRPFALLGIHCESQKILEKLTSEKTVTWRSWADGQQGPIAQRWEIQAFPTMVLIDHTGVIRWRSSGVPNEETLSKMVEQLATEAEASPKGE